MSDIGKARELIGLVLGGGSIDDTSRRVLTRALGLMHRERAVRRASPQRVVITASKRAMVRKLAATTDMTYHQIADATGLRNTGRVSDVMHGKR